jgi:hypothetical protein
MVGCDVAGVLEPPLRTCSEQLAFQWKGSQNSVESADAISYDYDSTTVVGRVVVAYFAFVT